MKCLSAAALALLIATPALAQNAPGTDSTAKAAPPAAATAPSNEKFVTSEAKDQWLVGNLWNKSVHDAAGKPIGDLKDVLIGPDGKVQALVIGVGGFLGLGEKNVAVNYDYLKQNGSITPDRIVLRMSEQDLRSAPSFIRANQPK